MNLLLRIKRLARLSLGVYSPSLGMRLAHDVCNGKQLGWVDRWEWRVFERAAPPRTVWAAKNNAAFIKGVRDACADER